MTREELIKIIYNSSSTASCPQAYNCNKSAKDNCWNCAEGLLTEYENKIRNETLEDVFNSLLENTKPTEKYIDSEIIVKILKQLQNGGTKNGT